MKNKIIIAGFTALLILGGCKKLDQIAIIGLTEKEVTPSYDYVKTLCFGVYSFTQNGFLYINNQAMMASATDEAEHTLETATVQKFNVGAWNAYDNPNDIWLNYFKGIRAANIFINSANNVDLELYRMDPVASSQIVYKTRSAEIRNWKYEVRFLRAYFYFELIKRYGGVPIITTYGPITDDYSNVMRNTLADCIKFITDECDSAYAKLPLKYPKAEDYGRATKGAAMALKSRTLLYAASDLFNTPSWAGSYANPELISVTGDRAAKWQAAANAAKVVIDSAAKAGYSLTSYPSLFASSTYNNAEVIFRKANSNSNSFEIANRPIGYDLGQSGTTPSQNLIDDYEVKVNATTAVPFDWNNPVHAANPYAPAGMSRDPRLGFTVLLNNSTIMGRPVQAYVGGLDGPPKDLATKTGYYLRKYNDVTLDILNGRTSNHAWIYFRLGEIYLNYAEALNEVNPGHADIALYVNKIRQRTGVAMPALPAGLTQAQMRDAIRHERRIELAFEDHRFWDVRRWMLGTTYFNVPLRGVTITLNTDGTFSYTRINVEDRVFDAKMYLYPIPQRELFIATKWVQNPLW